MERTYYDFEADFRKDFDLRYKSKGYGFERYRPAYQFGFESYSRLGRWDWQAVEPELKDGWLRIHPSDQWGDFRDAVRVGFDRRKEGFVDAGSAMEGRSDHTTGAMPRTFEMYERYFRTYCEENFDTRGQDYQQLRPAFQYGYELASDPRYQGRDWHEIEMEARRDWGKEYPGEAWNDCKDAVEEAYQRVRLDAKLLTGGRSL